MRYSLIPACFFPSTVLFIDEGNSLLMNSLLQLRPSIVPRFYKNARDALMALQVAQKQSDYINQHCLTESAIGEGENPLTTQGFSVNLSAIHTEIYNPKRFNEVSVVVVDYAAPGLNGLDFCRTLRKHAVKKILLAGPAESEVAIKALNEGLIDQWIEKHDPRYVEKVIDCAAEMQLQYFMEISNLITNVLATKTLSCLRDDCFYEFFTDLCNEHEVMEYYLMEISGSFLMLNAKGDTHSLLVRTARDLKGYYDFALKNNASTALLSQLEKGEKIPYFWQSHGLYAEEWSEWSSYLHPAIKLQGSQTYYVAFIKNSIAFDIHQQRILSFNNYLSASEDSFKALTLRGSHAIGEVK